MSTKLFVGGLPWAMDNERLKQVFAEYGDVADARVILDRETGRSRGFGFVTYSDEESATKALALDGNEVDGRRIRVDRAQEKERPRRGAPRPEGPGGAGRPRSPGGGGREFGSGGGGAGAGAGAGPRDGGRREFKDDWGGGDGDRGRERGRKGKGKGRGRRRGGRGARGGGGESLDGPPGGIDDFDDDWG